MTHKYTKRQQFQIREMVRALKGARPHVAGAVRDRRGLCYALYRWESAESRGATYHAQDCNRAARRHAQRLVSRALGGSTYLEGWLLSRGHTPPTRHHERVALRLAWLDQLVADCEDALFLASLDDDDDDDDDDIPF